MKRIPRHLFETILNSARTDYEDLHRVVDPEGKHSKKDETSAAQRRAAQYLAGGFAILKELGLPQMAAVFASLSRTELSVDKFALFLLNGSMTEASQEPAEAVSEGTILPPWEKLKTHLRCGLQMRIIVSEVSSEGSRKAGHVHQIAAIKRAIGMIQDTELFMLALLLAQQLESLLDPKEKEGPVVPTTETADAEKPAEIPPVVAEVVPETKTLAPIPAAEQALLNLDFSPSEAASRLLSLPLEARGMAIAGQWDSTLSAVPPREATSAAERLGRRLEDVLDQMPPEERSQTFGHLVTERQDEGGITIVLSMVRGFAGSLSTTAQYLTQELVAEIYETDPDLNSNDMRGARLIYLTWTLVMENPNKEPVMRFLTETEKGQEIIRELEEMAQDGGDEEAQTILRTIGETYQTAREEDERKATEDTAEEG